MFLTLTKRIKSGYIIALILLLTSYFIMFFTIQKLVQATTVIEHTYTIVNKLEELKGEMVDVETGARGYVITKDPRFLKPYNSGKRNMPLVIEELKKLTEDNIAQQNSLGALSHWIKRKMDYMESGISTFQKNGFTITEDMTIAREPSRIAMDSIRMYISKMKNTEETLMYQRKSNLTGFFKDNKIITIISLAVALLAGIFSWMTYSSENRAKVVADENIQQYRKKLEENITELQRINAELQELKSLEKFTATGRIARTIAHEVRNPLTNISLATEQLQDAMTDNPDSKMLLEMISRNANRINQLVSELLNATRFVQLEFTEMNVNQIVDETLELAKDRIELKQIKVETFYSDDLCLVSIDSEKMKFALLNIIVNAVEAMEKGSGILRLKTRKEKNKCIIEINDNGIGMDEDTQQKLFEPYFTAKPRGNGLGLTNTQNIVLNHGGSIKVDSQPQHGSTFIVTLDISNKGEN